MRYCVRTNEFYQRRGADAGPTILDPIMDTCNNPWLDDSYFIASTSYMDFLLGLIASAPFFLYSLSVSFISLHMGLLVADHEVYPRDSLCFTNKTGLPKFRGCKVIPSRRVDALFNLLYLFISLSLFTLFQYHFSRSCIISYLSHVQ